MLVLVHTPRPPLDRFVEHIVFYEGYDPEHTMEKLLPDGAVEIIIDMTDTPKRLFDRDDLGKSRSFRRAWISGMRREYIVIEAAPQSSMAVIRFRPGGAFPFLGLPLSEITDVVTELDTLLPGSDALRDRLLEAPNPAAKFETLERFLLDRAGDRLALHPVVAFLVDGLMEPRDATIAGLVGGVGYSHRHTIALFKKWVGLNPKQFCRIRKFQAVVQRLSGGREIQWADVARDCGYYDQAHFINEFRAFSGMTPGAYREAWPEHVNYVPL